LGLIFRNTTIHY